jgi:hypothetical protein
MYHRRVRVAALLAFAAAVLAGCNRDNGGSSGKTGSSSNAGGSGSATIQSVKYDQLEKDIAAKKGKIVVVDVWATW